MIPLRARLLRLLAPLALVATGACRDAPTVPGALQLLAGGAEWAAVPAPHGLPDLATWLPYLGDDTPAAVRAHTSIDRLATEARALRAADPARAEALDQEAVRAAVVALDRSPPPEVLRAATGAVDLWEDRVRAQVDLDRAPELGRSLARVSASRTAAAAALTAGDTASAVLHLASAAERIRSHTPHAVALRVLTVAEARLSAEATRDPAGLRALHLVRSARQELVDGNPQRALQRALYALQLSDGAAVAATEESDGRCPGLHC